MHIAHKKEDGSVQTLIEHLQHVASCAEQFAQPFGMGELAATIGLLHDLGKYSDAFFRRISCDGKRVDHATAGAQAVWETSPKTATAAIAAYCMMSHHTGLVNGGTSLDEGDESTFYGRLKKRIEPYHAFQSELTFSLPERLDFRPVSDGGFSASLLIRMLFSCLVDADFLDTEAFIQGETERGGYAEIPELCERLLEHTAGFGEPTTAINQRRGGILQDCLRCAQDPQGIYTLTVPTGGGKTISSLAFALNHARKHHLSRVIYVIPYTSILEQTAGVFSDILGKNNVVAHYANALCDNDEQDDRRNCLATENWDAPVIVTTNVQFFQSLFGARTSVCRKLHNIANSVIIFDEAQMLPKNYLLPCVHAIAELAANYRCTPVLCTATQSALDTLMPKGVVCREICQSPRELYEFFRRVSFRDEGPCSDQALAERLVGLEQVLCIVNTRRHAQNLCRLLPAEDTFHLSATMVPVQRVEILGEVRRRLRDGLPCRVVSTSLVEAGVDVDFPTVWRAEAGLDSIIQAAGRCNREGRRSPAESTVHIFRPEEGYTLSNQVKQTLSAYREVLRRHSDDIASLAAIRAYFTRLFAIWDRQAMDTLNLLDTLSQGYRSGMSFPFADIAGRFRVIEDDTTPLLIPLGERAQQILAALQRGERSRSLFREAGHYCVNVRDRHLQDLIQAGCAQRLDEGICFLTDLEQYSPQTGLALTVQGGQGIFI